VWKLTVVGPPGPQDETDIPPIEVVIGGGLSPVIEAIDEIGSKGFWW
jgi:hypothetical protein